MDQAQQKNKEYPYSTPAFGRSKTFFSDYSTF